MTPQLLVAGMRTWRRELPSEGAIVVSPGDRVEPDTVVAECQISAPAIPVELGQAQPVVSEGQEVQAGDVVARRKKLLRGSDEVCAPVAGTVVMKDEAVMLLRPPPLSLRLEAQLPGAIAAIRANWSVDVEGVFALLRGWGGRGESCHGKLGEDIAVAVEPLTIGSLQALGSQGARAVVAPGWAADSPPQVSSWVPALFFTEPSPKRPMAAAIAELLQRHVGRGAALRLGSYAALAVETEGAEDPQCFGPGSWVRTADGRTGRVLHIGDSSHFFPSGVRGVPAEIDLGDRTESVALDSLEWVA